jgi:hypothetical protein
MAFWPFVTTANGENVPAASKRLPVGLSMRILDQVITDMRTSVDLAYLVILPIAGLLVGLACTTASAGPEPQRL